MNSAILPGMTLKGPVLFIFTPELFPPLISRFHYGGNKIPFWNVIKRRFVAGYGRFETTYRFHVQGSSRSRRLLGP